jgi:hypothetical protein
MKRSLTIYTIIVLILTNLFTYMYFSKKGDFESKNFQTKLKKQKDSLVALDLQLATAKYFTLENNENAQNYLESANPNKTILIENLIPYVTDKLLDYNANPEGNPYTGQDKLGDSKFIINKVKIINHRWIIADYSNGDLWGEVLLKYFLNDDETISFEVIQSVIYPKQ